MRNALVLAAVSAGIAGGAAMAHADAPRDARIAEGRSMAGVALGSRARLAAEGDRVRDGRPSEWGTVLNGTCFEGSNCRWRVAGGGTVEVIRSVRTARIQRIATTARSWRTDRGTGRGSTPGALRRAYGRRLVRRTTCGLNGFGGVDTGYVLNSRHHGERRFTFFALSPRRTHVARVWIGRGRVLPGSAC